MCFYFLFARATAGPYKATMDHSDKQGGALDRRIRQHVAGRPHRFFAVVQPGFEEIGRDELRGAGVAEGFSLVEGGLEFEGRLDGCYRANLCSRVLTRVLMRLDRFSAARFERLTAKTADFPWELYLNGSIPLAISVSCSRSRLYHTGRIEEEMRRAIGERLMAYGIEPPAGEGDGSAAPQTVYARFENDVCVTSLDSSGLPLYRRGYKTHITSAPLRETIAAALLHASGLERCTTLSDTMCGSGTFSMEAAHIWSGRLAGDGRAFAFERWPAFRPAAFAHLKKTLSTKYSSAGEAIERRVFCADIDPSAIKTARANMKNAGLSDAVIPVQEDFFAAAPNISLGEGTLLVLNPPYGARIPHGNIASFYRRIGATVRERYASCAYCVIVPGFEVEKALSLSWDKKIIFMNGGIRVAAIIKQAP